jgi:hypothetical protein
MAEIAPDSGETCGLLERIRDGDREALGRLLARHRSFSITLNRGVPVPARTPAHLRVWQCLGI